MIRTMAVTADGELIKDPPMETLLDTGIEWYWVDFVDPHPEESALLDSFFSIFTRWRLKIACTSCRGPRWTTITMFILSCFML